VIDGDPEAIGGFVTDMGQEIRSPEWLRDHPVDVVIVPVTRRAQDVVRTMAATGIRCDSIMVEDGGRLVDYVVDTPLARLDAVLAAR
jgi:hypothetical protein